MNKQLALLATNLIKQVLSYIEHRSREQFNDIVRRYTTLSAHLLHQPADSTELVVSESALDRAISHEIPALERDGDQARR